MPILQAIAPLYNESAGLRAFDASLRAQADALPPDWSLRVLYVDDGSADSTPQILAELAARHRNVDYVLLSRNFGHQAALWAGLENADADAVVVLDGDGQHPVDMIPQMLRLHLAGIDLVRTRRRIDGERAERAWKYWISSQFHHLWTHLSQADVPPGTTEFALFSRQVLDALRQHRESHRYLRGLLSIVGFATAWLPITVQERAHGTSKYSFRKQLKLASDAIFSFSAAPLRLGLLLGAIFLLIAAGESVVVVWGMFHGANLRGWASLMAIMTLGFGANMVLLGLLGVYIGKIFEQVKRRPVYIVRQPRPGPAPDAPAGPHP